ncbi:MAG: hypothetical protein AVDCRST_MAG43-1080 [uncultured Thermomicrobiales bacterium]|uniref:TPM domain-containing protein n=1 Tax=uncultured Thermomicrobiales bacterium TaxID=1645740 RepID=A0A6J4UMI3_9BACT|nr:MAG: hypothetical protein AVDCRST_MAG43-1080 [uncultured Thermomicrobiales bacterium]
MTWNLLTIRIAIRPSRLLVFGMIAVALLLGHVPVSAQAVSTPQAAQQPPSDSSTSPTPAVDRGSTRRPNANGDGDDGRQIGISVEDRDTEAYRYLHLLEDPQRILKLEQRADLAEDAQRLTNHGLPTIIVLRESTETRDQSRASADQLRADRGVESSEGADDGMVMLVTIDPDSPRSGSVVLSFGRNALPKGGLTVESADDVYDRVMTPRLRRNKLYSALHVGIREIIYLETYIPEEQPPLTNTERTVRGAVNTLGPLALAGSAAGFVLMGRLPAQPGASRIRWTSPFVRTAVIVGGGAVLLFVAAVVAKSTVGVLSAFLLAVLVWTQLLIVRLSRQPAQSGFRSVSLPYRRTFRPARRADAPRSIVKRSRPRPEKPGR